MFCLYYCKRPTLYFVKAGHYPAVRCKAIYAPFMVFWMYDRENET